jgi:hypothetical protein
MSNTSSPNNAVPTNSHPIDPTTMSNTIGNAVLFCQDSIAILAAGKTKLNRLAVSPGIFDMADAISQLQNSMLDLLNWAAEVDARLGEPPRK